MDKREVLKSMLNNLINDKPEEAALDFHNYAVPKMRDIAGLSSSEVIDDEEVTVDDDVDVTSTGDDDLNAD